MPPGHVSPKVPRRPHFPGQPGPPTSSPYSDNVLRTSGGPQVPPQNQGPLSFTRALEVTDSLQQGGMGRGEQEQQGNRESVYDINYEISV